MELKRIEHDFSVCKVTDFSLVNLDARYCFIGKTDEELSLVCLTQDVPENTTERDDGWKAFRIQGELDFSLIGILSRISGILAEHSIGIFAVSTYNTDYILTKAHQYETHCVFLQTQDIASLAEYPCKGSPPHSTKERFFEFLYKNHKYINSNH